MVATAFDAVQIVAKRSFIFADALVKGSGHVADCHDLLSIWLIFSKGLVEKTEDKFKELKSSEAVARVEEILLYNTLQGLLGD